MNLQLILLVPIAFFITGTCLPIIRAIFKIFKYMFGIIKAVYMKILKEYKSYSRKLQTKNNKKNNDLKPNNIILTKYKDNQDTIEGLPICLNDRDDSMEQLNTLNVLIEKVKNPSKKSLLIDEYNKISEEILSRNNVIDQINIINKPIKYLYDITLEYGCEKYQFDNIIISNDGIYVIDTSSIINETYVDEYGRFFSVKNDGTKEIIMNPVSKQNLKANILKDILKSANIECNIPIYPVILLASRNAKLHTENNNKSKEIYTDYVKFIKNIKCTSNPNTLVNRICYYLYEFSTPNKVDYLEKFNLMSIDFKEANKI